LSIIIKNLPVGDILLVSNGKFLEKLVFLDYESFNLDIKIEKNYVLEQAEKFLINYFENKIWYKFEYINYKKLNPLLREIMEIPFGEVRYYSDFNKFPRAVGRILSSNKIPIFIPCHRIISKNSIGGFTPSLKIKEILLRHEGFIPF